MNYIYKIRFTKINTLYTIYLNDNICGTCIYSYLVDEPKIIFILYLDIYDKYKNMGCGTILLYEVLQDAYKYNQFTHVSLDDASDNCHKQNNIYVRLGLVYVHGKNDNSMHGNIRHILHGKKNYRKLYQTRFIYDV